LEFCVVSSCEVAGQTDGQATGDRWGEAPDCESVVRTDQRHLEQHQPGERADHRAVAPVAVAEPELARQRSVWHVEALGESDSQPPMRRSAQSADGPMIGSQ
jgi:hypothetical protein